MKLKTFIICDDIRNEIGGKHSLIGVYQEKILFAVDHQQKSAWPKSLKLGFFIEIGIDKEIPSSFSFKKVVSEDEETIMEGKIAMRKDGKMIRMALLHPNFLFKKAGIIKFRIEFYNENKHLIETLIPDLDFSVEEQVIPGKFSYSLSQN